MFFKYPLTLISVSLFALFSLNACSSERTPPQASNSIESDKAQSQVSETKAVAKKVLSQELPEGIFKNAESVRPLSVGALPTNFMVRKADGTQVMVKPTEMTKPVILTFFRGGWCPYCNVHLAELRTVESSLKAMGFDVWFMSIDKPELLYESLKEPNIGYTLFSDAELEATKAFGIGFAIDDATHEKYLGYGIDLSKASGFDHHVLPAPSTFILGEGGRVHFQHTNPDYTVRLSPEEIMAAAQSYVDEH